MRIFIALACLVLSVSPVYLLAETNTNPNTNLHPSELEIRVYGDGVVFMHLTKAGGTTIREILANSLGSTDRIEDRFEVGHKYTSEMRQLIESKPYTSGHTFLKQLSEINSLNRPVITFLRNPFDRAVSNIRFWKQQADAFPGMKFVKNLDLNNPAHLEEIFQKIPGTFPMLEFFAPPGLDVSFENMTNEKLDQCVAYGLKKLAFIGTVEEFEESLHRLNLAINIQIDVDKASKLIRNKTSDSVEQITNPECIALIKNRVKWEMKLYEKLLAAQSWRIALPMSQKPTFASSHITQFIFPQGFDPDVYLKENGLVKEASEAAGTDIWKVRKWALVHYITYAPYKKELETEPAGELITDAQARQYLVNYEEIRDSAPKGSERVKLDWAKKHFKENRRKECKTYLPVMPYIDSFVQ